MSIGLERGRERHGYPHQEEVTGRSIASAVHQIDELNAAIAAVREIHSPTPTFCARCGCVYPCATIRALPDPSGDAA